jgi:4-diphosphocytidyl-2C-methyl-D-erythritol kinase
LKRLLRLNGALGAQLSGSGSTVYGIARTREEAIRAATSVDRGTAAVRIVRTLERGVAVAEAS